jgi:uncharacterized protein YciU (UPF0263 family)
MKVAGKTVVVTGGASGIGRALAERFAAEGARGVVVADIDAEWAHKAATGIGGLGVGCDVGDPDAIESLVRTAEDTFGPVDIFCSNAGFSDPAPADLSQPVDNWRRIVDVNMMAHVRFVACRQNDVVHRPLHGRAFVALERDHRLPLRCRDAELAAPEKHRHFAFNSLPHRPTRRRAEVFLHHLQALLFRKPAEHVRCITEKPRRP